MADIRLGRKVFNPIWGLVGLILLMVVIWALFAWFDTEGSIGANPLLP